jgi:predicted CXXCH cytochrome family protein
VSAVASGRGIWSRICLGAAGLLATLNAAAAPPPDHNQIFSGTWFHIPVADDDCGVCHTIHGDSDRPHLQAPIPDLCYQCHVDVATEDMVHTPVGEGRCVDCHAAHTSDHRPLLTKPVPALCIDCHPRGEGHVARHNMCITCHRPHSSNTAQFLRGERFRNCGKCHADKRQGESRHAPARDGRCLACHFTPHDPRFPPSRGLRVPYPLEVHVTYSYGLYALCDRCHDAALYTDEQYLSTGFRTAVENLHARHVQEPGAVTCSACHEMHAARRPALLVDWVRIPGEVPRLMQFLRFDGGGSCGPVCHGTATYLRDEGAELVGDGP